MKKGILKTIVLTGLIATMAFANASAVFASSSELTAKQISTKIEKIDNKYKVGATLSEEDSAFIIKYANLTNSSQTNSDSQVSINSVNAYSDESFPLAFAKQYEKGLTISVTGTFGGNAKFTGSSSPFWADAEVDLVEGEGLAKVTSVKFNLKATSYKLVPNTDVVKKIATGNISNSSTNTSFSVEQTKSLTGAYCVYITLEPTLSVKTTSSSYSNVLY